MSEQTPEPKPGDWVRFYRNGQLVIAQVAYVRIPSDGYYREAMTDLGSIRLTSILEIRSASHE